MKTPFNKISIEEVKKYWNERPCNIRHSQSPVGTKQYFDEVEKRKYFIEPHIVKFAEFEKWRGKKVLEIGCGIGTDNINFARFGAEVTAMDVSENSLDVARQRARVYGLEDKIKFYFSNAEELSKNIPV
ncbi:MAG: class I SAM-dependent methyltransferase, partial [Candidatus Pacebacteria bacterium]|nr:class I SAM-dependent methyltransferase [Candidatus Paceibacterota bacterium]